MLFQEAAREISECQWAGAVIRTFNSSVFGGRRDLLGSLARKLNEYWFFFAPTIQSNRESHPKLWKRMEVPRGKIRGQGCAIAIRRDVDLLDFWTGQKNSFVEPIELPLPISEKESIYAGNRDSESRIAQGLRLKLDQRDLTIWNVHLTTIVGERKGNTTCDQEAAMIRTRQLNFLIDAYKKHKEYPTSKNTCWIIGGDFNATPSELSVNQDLVQNFRNAFLGPSRPNNYQVDTILLDAEFFPDIEKERKSKTKILVTHAKAESLSSTEKLNSSLDSSYSSYIQRLLEEGVDHFPILFDDSLDQKDH